MPAAVKARKPTVARTAQLITVPDLTGGQNLRVSPTLVGADQARELKNWSLEEPGALTVRLGYQRFSSATFGTGRGQGGARVYASSRVFTLFAHNSSVYTVTDAGVGTAVLSGLSTNQVFFPYDRQIVAVFDGLNRPKKSTDGSSWTNFGIDAPTVKPVLSSGSSGSLAAGKFEIAYSYKQRSLGYEGNISSGSTIALTASTGSIAATATASTEAQVDAYVWYARKLSAGESIFRKVSSGAASTFTFTSSNWTNNDEAPTNHNVLQAGRFGVVWKNRWWVPSATVSNRLHFSELFLPQAFPTDFYIDIPFTRGDAIAAVAPLGDVLVIFGQSKEVFLVIGQTSLDFEVRPSAGAIAGCFGPRAWCQVEQGILHASAEGVHIFDGASDKLLSYDIDPAWRDLANASAAELAKMPMAYEFRRKAVRIGVPRLYPRGVAGEWELNLNRTRQDGTPAWCNTDRAIGGYITQDGNESDAGQRGELISWSDTVGILFKESTGTTANSSNLIADYEGPTLALGLHRARVLDTRVEYEPHGGNLTSETVIDGVSQSGIALSIGSGLAVYGTAVYGTATYGGSGRRVAYTPQKLSAEGRTVTHRLTYAGQERAKLFAYTYSILPESMPRRISE